MKKIGKLAFSVEFGALLSVAGVIYLKFVEDGMFTLVAEICIFIGIAILMISIIAVILTTMFGIKPRKIKNGRPGIGFIEEVNLTGTYINEQPLCEIKLHVADQFGQQFSAVLRKIIPATQAAAYQYGAMVAVVIGENNKIGEPSSEDKVFSEEEAQALFNQIAIKKGFISEEVIRINESGVESYAKVKDMRPLSSMTAERVDVELDLELTKTDQTIVPVTITKQITQEGLDQVQPGRIISVIYLPHDPNQLIIKIKASESERIKAFSSGK